MILKVDGNFEIHGAAIFNMDDARVTISNKFNKSFTYLKKLKSNFGLTKIVIKKNEWELIKLISQSIVGLCFCVCSINSLAGGDWTYIEEGRILDEELVQILAAEDGCISSNKCIQKYTERAFYRHTSEGLKIYIYEVKRLDVANELLKKSSIAFIDRQLGARMTIEIYDVKHAETLKNIFLFKVKPIITLKLEKNNVIH